MDATFFGPDSCPLFGAYHPPRSSVGRAKSVLICPPIGQEYLRTHWALRLVANQLSRKGCHVLRFDYRGVGDSFGEPYEVDSLDHWRDDIESAIEYLKEVSDCEAVMLLGLRTGAALACDVAACREDIHSLVAWEPVLNGQKYLEQLRGTHQTMIDLWYQEVATVNDDAFEEILGTLYHRELLREIDQWRVDFDAIEVPQLIIERQESMTAMSSDPPVWQKRIEVDDEDSWGKLSDLEVAWLRPKTSHALIKTTSEMFTRLEQREMLAGAAG